MTLANAIAKIEAVINAGVAPAPDSFEEAFLTVIGAVEDNAEAAEDAMELPTVAAADNGKVLTVVSGAWAKANLPAETVELPAVTVADNGKVLKVVDGAWAAVAETTEATT